MPAARPALRFGLWGGLLLGFAMPALGSGCRPGEGDRCFCHGECRGGLVCAANGATLAPGQCVTDVSNNVEDGVCVESANESQGGEGADPPPFWDLRFDLPKTDFAPPSDSGMMPTTGSGTEGSSTGTDGSSSGTDGSSSGTDGSSSGTDGSTGTSSTTAG